MSRQNAFRGGKAVTVEVKDRGLKRGFYVTTFFVGTRRLGVCRTPADEIAIAADPAAVRLCAELYFLGDRGITVNPQ